MRPAPATNTRSMAPSIRPDGTRLVVASAARVAAVAAAVAPGVPAPVVPVRFAVLGAVAIVRPSRAARGSRPRTVVRPARVVAVVLRALPHTGRTGGAIRRVLC